MESFLHVMLNNSFSSISEMDWIVVAIALYLLIWFSVVRPLLIVLFKEFSKKYHYIN